MEGGSWEMSSLAPTIGTGHRCPHRHGLCLGQHSLAELLGAQHEPSAHQKLPRLANPATGLVFNVGIAL